MLTAVVTTIAFFPIYLALRAPFWRIPLHIDTGYYISGDTLVNGRIRFSEGWNARYAGCSKVVPEFIYSLVYLLHCRRGRGEQGFQGDRYKRYSRLYASVFNYITAVVVGLVAAYLFEWEASHFCAGLILFGLLSSEPQWGVYHECGELFEVLGHIGAIGFLAVGLGSNSLVWIGLASFTWLIGAAFVKLSSAAGFAVLFGIILVVEPWCAVPTLAGAAAAVACYVAWIYVNGRRPIELVRGLAGHEVSYGQRADGRVLLHRLTEKCTCLVRTIVAQPLTPILACVGAVIGGTRGGELDWLLAAYVLGVSVTYAAQATNCWYYQIPLLPVIALFAAPAIVTVAHLGPVGVAALPLGALIWIGRNTMRAVRLDVQALDRWCWNGHLADDVTVRNTQLDGISPEIAGTVGGRSLLVYGPMTQAYVLTGAAYVTDIVTPEHCLEEVCPNWQPSLNQRLLRAPPSWILDTSNCFDAAAARDGLKLDYRLAFVFGGGFRLFEFEGRSGSPPDGSLVRTFEGQSMDRLDEEVVRAGIGLADRRGREVDDTLDRAGRALRELLAQVACRGYRRIGLYGAGRFTVRHAEVYRRSSVRVAVVLDDRAERHGARFLDWPVGRLEEAQRFDVDAVVVSSDRFASPMAARARRMFKGSIAVFSPDRPPGELSEVGRACSADGAAPAVARRSY